MITIPNLLSSLRIALIPILFIFILNFNPSSYVYLIALYFFTVSLDFFDGYLARKLSQETELGKILDPLADKFLIFMLVIAFMITADFPLWLAIPIIIRDVAIVFVSIMMYQRSHSIKPSIFIGKITFGLLSVLLMVYIVDLHPGFELHILKRFFSILAFGYLFWSFSEYYKIYRGIRSG
jgi:cardiolipin synthase